MAIIEHARQVHATELEEALNPQARRDAFSLWRRSIDTGAHDYADLVLNSPCRDQIIQLEVDTFMTAYLNGYMAGCGWIDQPLALQSAFRLGRRLRDRLREMGVSFAGVSANLGTAMDKALMDIVALGVQSITPPTNLDRDSPAPSA